MALAPAPGVAPEGLRVYPGEASTRDKLERGDFLGERRETITCLVQQPGTLTLPAITYAWWNPTTRTLESKTLPAMTFDVAAPPAAATPTPASRNLWPWLATAALIAIGVWQRERLSARFDRLWKALHPPDRTAARKLLRACRRNDAPAASAAWTAWRDTRPAGYQPPPDLQPAVLAMQRHRFGPAPASSWQGDDLARAFQQQKLASSLTKREASPLPPLNP